MLSDYMFRTYSSHNPPGMTLSNIKKATATRRNNFIIPA